MLQVSTDNGSAGPFEIQKLIVNFTWAKGASFQP